jgi:hypothetical protein
MATTGITIERNAHGIPHFARIDLKKHGNELKDFSSKGIVVEESPYNPKFVKKIKQSRKEYENGQFEVVDPENFWNR